MNRRFGKSYFRVYVYVYYLILIVAINLIGCLSVSNVWINMLMFFLTGSILWVGVICIRCENCHKSYGDFLRYFSHNRSKLKYYNHKGGMYLPAKRCPYCGLERL